MEHPLEGGLKAGHVVPVIVCPLVERPAWSPRASRRMARVGLEAVGVPVPKEYDMMLSGWVRPRRVLVAVAALAAGTLACSDTTKPKEVATMKIVEPRFTDAVGFRGAQIGRGNLGTFHIQSKADGYDVELKSHDNTDIVVSNIVIDPGGTSGWHTHPGPALVVVKTGAVTFYHGDDRSCTGTRHPAGTAFVEAGGTVGIARNEGTGEATVVATFLVPTGIPARLDAARPGNCAF